MFLITDGQVILEVFLISRRKPLCFHLKKKEPDGWMDCGPVSCRNKVKQAGKLLFCLSFLDWEKEIVPRGVFSGRQTTPTPTTFRAKQPYINHQRNFQPKELLCEGSRTLYIFW